MADEQKVEKRVEMLGDYILMRRDHPEEKMSPNGLHLPKQVQVADSMTWGTVVAVGANVAGHPTMGLSVKPGARIMVGRYTGAEVKVNGEDAVVVRLEDVYGIERDAC